MTYMLSAAGVVPDELEVLRANPSWSRRVAAAHTIPRELRSMNDYAPDPQRLARIDIPVLLLVGGQTEPRRRELFEQSASLFKAGRVAVLEGQRHAAHQTGPDMLATALRRFLLA